jgi:hypothetical protein
MADASKLNEAFAQFEAALHGGSPPTAATAAINPCQFWKTVRPEVVELIAVLDALGTFVPWAAQASSVLKTLQAIADAACGTTAGVSALPTGFSTPCDAWKAVRPAVLNLIAALNEIGNLLPIASRVADVLQRVADLLDMYCGIAPSAGPGPSGAGAAGMIGGGPASGGGAAAGTIPTTNEAPTIRHVHRYGWVPDLPDARDHLYAAPPAYIGNLPSSVNLRSGCPTEIYDQGQLGSCTANAIVAAIQFDQIKQSKPNFISSRLFIYYNERVMMGDNCVNQDSGAQIRDGVKSVATQGAPPEYMWPYVISQFTVKPPLSVYQSALQYTIKGYQRVPQSLSQMKGCLASGFPFVFGFTVYSSFEDPQVTASGVVPMPNTATESVLGGHAMLAIGYDDAQQRFFFRNSWGPGYGNGGYGTIPYAYLMDNHLSDDFWTIRLV